MRRIEFRPRSRVNPQSAWLSKFARNVTSQDGEDGIIEKIFATVPPANRWCLEIGAYDGKLHSNTWNLVNNLGWNAVLVEGRSLLFAQLASRYNAANPEPEGRAAGRVAMVHEYAAFEGPRSLDAILSHAGAPKDLDFASIDIDSNDWHLWESLKAYRPRVLQIEFNATIPNDVFFVQERVPDVTHGCSLLALVELGKSKGYELVATTTANAFFVLADLYPAFGIADNDIDAMYFGNAHLLTRLFQGYDGELILAGYERLHWPNLSFTAQDIQVLPRSLRRYGMMFVDSQLEARTDQDAAEKR
ncbi:MAG TPA: hypothetical protein VFD95_14240 [Usitatibacter sp.]|nr:hypothetical protein [Usitatibacter sp.]